MSAKTVKKIISAVTNSSPALVLIFTFVLGIFAVNLIRTSETFLSENYLSHQRTRGIIKTNLLVQRGMKTALVAIERRDEDLFYEALDQVDAARTFLYTDVYRPAGENRQLDSQIAALQQDLAQLQRSAMQGELINDGLSELNDKAELIFLQLAEADAENWTQTVEGSARRHRNLRGIYYYFGLLCLALIAMTVLLYRTLKRRRMAEEELQRANASLESHVESRTRDLKISNERLGEKSTLLQSILDAIPAPIFYKDREGIYTGCNQAFEQYIGLSKGKIVGSSVYGVAPRDLAEIYHRADEELMNRGGAQVYDASVRYADGSRHEVVFHKAVLNGGNGTVSGLVGVMLDITEIKTAQQALEKSERRFRELSQQFQALLDGISDALVLFSPQREAVWANRGAADLFGHDHKQLEGSPCKNFRCQSSDRCTECVKKCFTSGQPVEMMDRTPDGRCWGVKLFPIKDEGGRVDNVIQIISDITEKTRLREQATQASRLASLGELAAGVAHEINNPNAQILLNLPIIGEALDDSQPILDEHFHRGGDFRWGGLEYSRMREEIPKLIAGMQDASRRIKNIVEDLKNFSRREPSDQMLSVDLNEAVTTAVRLTRNTIKRATNHLDVDYDRDLPSVRGIRQRLEQVLVNLIINASQALTDRLGKITVRTCHDERRNRCRVVVRDEGVGMSEDVLSHITDPFFTTRREVGGTGLGLSISTRIIKEHGGELFFESTPGKGTTVTVDLPAEVERAT